MKLSILYHYGTLIFCQIHFISFFPSLCFVFIYFPPAFFCFLFFLAVLSLRCCAQAFSSCGEWGLLFVVVRRLLIAVASLVAEHGL